MNQESVAPAFGVEIRVTVGGAMENAERIGLSGLDGKLAKGQGRMGEKIGFDAEDDALAADWMIEFEFAGVETEAWGGFAGVNFISEDGVAGGVCMDADLVGAAGDGLGFKEKVVADGAEKFEAGFGQGDSRCEGAREVFFAEAHDAGFNGELLARGFFVGEKVVSFLDGAGGELFGEGAAGFFGFGEENDAGCGFIEAMDDSEIAPARFAIAKPFVEAFSGVRAGGMGVQASGLVDAEQVIVLENDAGRLVYQNCHAPL